MKKILATITIVLSMAGYTLAQDKTFTSTIAQIDNKLISDTTLNSPFADEPYSGLLISKQSKVRTAPWYVQKFSVSAGFFFAINNTDVQVNGTGGRLGTDINFESDLGFNKTSSSFLGDFQWRSSSRSRFDLSFIWLDRSSSYTLQKTFNFGNHTYNADASVNAFFNTSIYRFSYGYAIFSEEDWELGLMIGLHIVKFSTGISAIGANVSGSVSDDFGITAPLPDAGIWGGYAIDNQWAIIGELGYLKLTIDNITGRILAGNLGVTYRAIDNLRFALSYTNFNVKVNAHKTYFDGQLKWGYNGPSLTATYTFGQKGWKSGN